MKRFLLAACAAALLSVPAQAQCRGGNCSLRVRSVVVAPARIVQSVRPVQRVVSVTNQTVTRVTTRRTPVRNVLRSLFSR